MVSKISISLGVCKLSRQVATSFALAEVRGSVDSHLVNDLL